jgi:superfamily II DNA or RNA helicase
MPTIYDNINYKLIDGIKAHLKGAVRADYCVGYFNIRGWNMLAPQIDMLPGAPVDENGETVTRVGRILVGMQKAPIDELRDEFRTDLVIDHAYSKRQINELARDFRKQLVLGIQDKAYETTIATLKRQIDEHKIIIKLYLRKPLHAKLYLAYLPNNVVKQIGFIGSSNLTSSGLASQGELNTDITDIANTQQLADWFEERWNDSKCVDITSALRAVLDESWASDNRPTPYEIYLKIAYHLSREARTNEFRIPRVIDNTLLKFQREAVVLAAHHLNKRNGVIIGDVVGLGKTITATAVARIFQEDFDMETLILSPKNLTEMWEGYVHEYGLRAKVISQSMVTTELPTLRRYRLVIIDESHNLRNEDGKRYRAIKEYIAENESKVILLSATPYNKTFQDLANQLRLFISDDTDLGIRPEHYINALGGAVKFAARHVDIPIRSVHAFALSDFVEDWQELMRLYLVRRTRSFIKEHYAVYDGDRDRSYLVFPDGTRSYFPERIPKAATFHFDSADPHDQYAALFGPKVVNIIEELDLPRYGLSNYVRDEQRKHASPEQRKLLDNLSRAGKRLKGFTRTNLFKRLESSGHSFLLSLERHLLRNCVFIHAIDTNQPLPIGTSIFTDIDEHIDDQDIDGSELITPSTSYTMQDFTQRAQALYNLSRSDILRHEHLPSTFFSTALRTELARDAANILKILTTVHRWNSQNDQKLRELITLLTHTHPHDKVLIFTQYADTASYLAQQLHQHGIMDAASVTGSDDNPTLLAKRFSPRDQPLHGARELRILIATDVLSEGQNLQDAHIVVNYDLPWALIRLIQRAGRVDRIGQRATEILSYSFLPAAGIEQIINLRKRLRDRIRQNAEVIGADEVFFDGDPVNLSDLYNEKSGILDGDSTDSDIDLASQALAIWRTATDADETLLERIPKLANWSYSAKHIHDHVTRSGAIVYGRTADDTDVLTWLDSTGTVVSQAQHTILAALRCRPDTPAVPELPNHFDLVQQSVLAMNQQAQSMAGTLGKRNSVKFRIYTLLEAYEKRYTGTLFARAEIKQAINDIYQFPLREFAQESIRRQLKAGADHDTIVLMVIALHEDDKLVVRSDDEQPVQEPQIICSLGLTA